MKDQFVEVEETAINRFGIVLEEIARAYFDLAVGIYAVRRESDTFIDGSCRFYFPVDASSQGEKRSFTERMDGIVRGGISCDYVESLGLLVDKASLNQILKKAEVKEKTKLFNRYIKKYNKKYPVIVLEGCEPL